MTDTMTSQNIDLFSWDTLYMLCMYVCIYMCVCVCVSIYIVEKLYLFHILHLYHCTK